MILLLTAVLSLMAPASVIAMQSHRFEFGEELINANWTGKGQLSMQKGKDGILLQTGNGTGMLTTTVGADIRPQSGVIIAASGVPSRFYFSWTTLNEPQNRSFTLPFGLTTGAAENQDFSLEGNWQTGSHEIAIILPPHTAIVLMNIELRDQNIFEQVLEPLRSFWVFDTYRPYSINFVWGPQIGWNTAERQHLFDVVPPVSLSGTLAMNVMLLVLMAAMYCIGVWRKTQKKQTLKRIGILLLFVWILFDARMGSEFLSWVWTDHTTYISAEHGQRQFRDRDAFYDFADFAAPFVIDRESYVFFAEYPWPYLGNMRYLTYPSIPGIDYLNDDTWVIYRRSDMGVDELGQMTVDGEAVSPQGKILGRFDDTSFIFRVSK